MSNYKNILVAIDINAPYQSIISKALSICQSVEDINLLYVSIPTTYIRPYLYGMEYNTINDGDRMVFAREKRADIAREFGLNQHNVIAKLGAPAQDIKDIANEKHMDLIVIGTHGKSGFALLLGSTANAVLHGAKQDVLAIRVHDVI